MPIHGEGTSGMMAPSSADVATLQDSSFSMSRWTLASPATCAISPSTSAMRGNMEDGSYTRDPVNTRTLSKFKIRAVRMA